LTTLATTIYCGITLFYDTGPEKRSQGFNGQNEKLVNLEQWSLHSIRHIRQWKCCKRLVEVRSPPCRRVTYPRSIALSNFRKPQLRPPRCDTRVTPEEKRRFLARRAQEMEQRRAIFNAETDAEET